MVNGGALKLSLAVGVGTDVLDAPGNYGANRPPLAEVGELGHGSVHRRRESALDRLKVRAVTRHLEPGAIQV